MRNTPSGQHGGKDKARQSLMSHGGVGEVLSPPIASRQPPSRATVLLQAVGS